MFNLGQYLHQLLLIHQQVGVPGIGVFSKVRIAAKFDEASNRFLPPTHTYALIQHATTDEYLITQVAKVKHVSIESARQEVDSVVDQLLIEISDKGEAKLEEIGFLKEAHGAYVLLPFEQNNWGLQPVQEYPLTAAKEVSPAPREEPKTSETEQETLIATSDTIGVPDDPVDHEKKSNKALLWGAIIVLLLLAASFYLWNQQSSRAPALEKEAVLAESEVPQSTDSLQQTITSQDSSLAAKEMDSIQQGNVAPIKEDPLVRDASKRPPFTIVLASFKTMDLAIKQARYFRTIGINAFVLESNMPRNRKKICYGNYSTKEAAKEELEKIRKDIDPAAYIYP